MRQPNTPGFFGYVAAMTASFLVFGGLIGCVAVTATLAAGDPLAAVWVAMIYPVMAAVYAMALGFPVALAGVLVVQVCCWGQANQWVHIAVAGLAGALLTTAYLPIVAFPGGEINAFLPVMVALAAAAGRAVVVPLVLSRRQLALTGGLSGTAR